MTGRPVRRHTWYAQLCSIMSEKQKPRPPLSPPHPCESAFAHIPLHTSKFAVALLPSLADLYLQGADQSAVTQSGASISVATDILSLLNDVGEVMEDIPYLKIGAAVLLKGIEIKKVRRTDHRKHTSKFDFAGNGRLQR